jgi:hypothetical protein
MEDTKYPLTMWIWTLDEELLNLNQVETIEVAANYHYDADADVDDIEDDDVEPDDHEVIAFLASGNEKTLFRHQDEGVVQQALELLAQFIGAHDMMDSFTQGKVLSLADLMTKAGEDSKN